MKSAASCVTINGELQDTFEHRYLRRIFGGGFGAATTSGLRVGVCLPSGL